MLKTQPLEFVWQSEDKISVVAILRQAVSRELLRNVHDDLFRAHKTVGLVVLGKGEVSKRGSACLNRSRRRSQHAVILIFP